jgi:hypothetical protein
MGSNASEENIGAAPLKTLSPWKATPTRMSRSGSGRHGDRRLEHGRCGRRTEDRQKRFRDRRKRRLRLRCRVQFCVQADNRSKPRTLSIREQEKGGGAIGSPLNRTTAPFATVKVLASRALRRNLVGEFPVRGALRMELASCGEIGVGGGDQSALLSHLEARTLHPLGNVG